MCMLNKGIKIVEMTYLGLHLCIKKNGQDLTFWSKLKGINFLLFSFKPFLPGSPLDPTHLPTSTTVS